MTREEYYKQQVLHRAKQVAKVYVIMQTRIKAHGLDAVFPCMPRNTKAVARSTIFEFEASFADSAVRFRGKYGKHRMPQVV